MSTRRGQVTPGRRVGELAEASGLTVRTLHYYEEIGLLVASERIPAGHRLCSDADVERLYRICLLRRLSFSLGAGTSSMAVLCRRRRCPLPPHLGRGC